MLSYLVGYSVPMCALILTFWRVSAQNCLVLTLCFATGSECKKNFDNIHIKRQNPVFSMLGKCIWTFAMEKKKKKKQWTSAALPKRAFKGRATHCVSHSHVAVMLRTCSLLASEEETDESMSHWCKMSRPPPALVPKMWRHPFNLSGHSASLSVVAVWCTGVYLSVGDGHVKTMYYCGEPTFTANVF